jgi:hypothetical protein
LFLACMRSAYQFLRLTHRHRRQQNEGVLDPDAALELLRQALTVQVRCLGVCFCSLPALARNYVLTVCPPGVHANEACE